MPSSSGDAQLKLIHAAMLSGVLLFLAVVLFVSGGRDGAESNLIFRWGWLAVAESAALPGLVSTLVTGHIAPGLGATLVFVFLMVHHRPSQLA